MKIYVRKNLGQLSEKNEKKGKRRKIALSLVYYYGKGHKREYEKLNLFYYDKPKTNLDKEHNSETKKLLDTIIAKRILDAQSTAHGFVSNIKSKIGFLVYFKSLVEKRYDSTGNHGNWLSAYRHLSDYLKGKDIPLERVDDVFLEGFKDYLCKCKNRKGQRELPLNPNSSLSYFSKVKTALREAYLSKMIRENPAIRVKSVKGMETHREYLTFEELQLLAKTPCEYNSLKRAFLFSALTGLRWSDIKNVKWENIKFSETNGWNLQYKQKKTKGAENLPIQEQAIKYLGDRKEEDIAIFKDLDYSAWNNLKLREWVMRAGITKKITFHCARHTFATLQLSMDTDIYTVSKMLGHRHLKTTEIYAKVIDKKKIDAANRIPELLAF